MFSLAMCFSLLLIVLSDVFISIVVTTLLVTIVVFLCEQ